MQDVSGINDTNTPATSEENEEEDHIKNYSAQLQLYYCNETQRKLMGQKQLNEIIEIVKGDVTHMRGDKKDFSVLSFGDHYSLVKFQHA
jgi:hypothetical protein